MKTLSEIIRATEIRNAKVIVETARGSTRLKEGLMVTAIFGSDANIQLTGILVGPDSTVDDPSIDHYLAELDDPKTRLSSGVEPESAYGDFHGHYEDYPGGLPEDITSDTATGNCIPPLATRCVMATDAPDCSAAAYNESEFDCELVEGLSGIMSPCLYEAGITEREFMKAWPHLVGDKAAVAQTELELLFAPAILLLGQGWQSKLKRICGYSQGHLQRVYSGKSAITAKLETALLKAYREEIGRCEEKVSRGMAGVIKILEAK